VVRSNEGGIGKMKNPWFRLYSEAVDDEKLRLLAFEDRWHFIALLCCKNTGILDTEPNLMRRKVAVKLGLDLRELGEVSRRLAEVGLIDYDSLQPLHWDERQFKSDTSTKRVKEYRERKQGTVLKDETKVKHECNVSETFLKRPKNTDTDTESDKPSKTDVLLVASDADDAQKKPDCPHQEIIALYHQILPACHRIVDWTPNRSKALKARWDENRKRQNLEYWKGLFEYIAKCPFLVGKVGNKPFLASLDWICKAENFAKIREGRYEATA
jgi:hypothetical protein